MQFNKLYQTNFIKNKTLILAFTRDAVPDLFALYAPQISDSRTIQGYLYFLFIYCITLFKIIPEIVFRKRHDPSQVTYQTQTDRRQYLIVIFL